MDKKKDEVDYAVAYRQFMNFGHGRSLKQFCEDEDYDYGKLQRYSRKAFWTKHTKLSESEVEGSGFMSLVHDDQQPSTTQTGDGPLPEGKGHVNEISFIKVRFSDGLTLSMSNVSVARMVSLLQTVHAWYDINDNSPELLSVSETDGHA